LRFSFLTEKRPFHEDMLRSISERHGSVGGTASDTPSLQADIIV